MSTQIEARRLSGADIGKTITGPGFDGGTLQVIRHASDRVDIAMGTVPNYRAAEVVNLKPGDMITITGKPS